MSDSPVLQEQRNRCEGCFYRLHHQGEGWCYMFESVFIGCKLFLGEVRG